jgi:hypothetical protein
MREPPRPSLSGIPRLTQSALAIPGGEPVADADLFVFVDIILIMC